MAANNAGWATLQIIPSLQGIGASLGKSLGGVEKIGVSAGQSIGKGIADGVESAKGKVDAAAAKVAKARDKESDAAGKVRAEEAKLQALRDKGVTDAGRLATAEERVESAKRRSAAASREGKRADDELARAKKNLDNANKSTGDSADSLSGKLRRQRGEVRSLGDTAGGVTTKLGGLFKLAGGAAVLSLPGMALAKGFKRLNDIDTAKAKLQALGQDAKATDVIMKNALNAVEGTAFGLGDAAALSGVIVGAGVKPGKELERTLKQVADTAAITGSDLGEIGSIYGKVAANGKLDGEVMAQLLDRQIGILPKLAEKYGVSAEAAKKMVSEGKVSFADFQNVMDGLVGGGAVKMGKTFSASMDNVMSALGKLGAEVLGPLFEKIPGWLETAKNKINELKTKIAEWKPKLAEVGQLFQKYQGWIKPIGAALGGVVVAMAAIALATKTWAIAQAALNVVMNANPISLIVIAIAALVGGLIYAYKHSETFRNVVQTAFNGIKVAAQFLWNNVLKPVFNLWVGYIKTVGNIALWLWNNALVPAFNGIKWAIGAFWNGVKITFGFFVDAIKNIGTVVGTVKDWIVARFTDVVGFVTSLPGKIGNAAKGMWDGIKNAFKGVINWIIRAWNKLEFKIPGFEFMGKKVGGFTLGLPKLNEFRRGGYTGNYGVNEVAGVVHGDEFVTRSESRRKMERNHPGVLGYINAFGQLPGYREGGRVVPGNVNPGGGRIPYGLPVGSNSGGYGGNGVKFPDWVMAIASRFGVAPSTYPGHQERDGKNKGIDWGGPVPKMQAFAEYLLSIKGQLEQVIWKNPDTGKTIGVADGQEVGPGTSQAGYYRDDWNDHMNHVHTRQSYSFGDAPGAIGNSAINSATGDSSTPSSPDGLTSGQYDYSQGSAFDKKQKYEQDKLKAKQDYDAALAKLKEQYGVGASGSELAERGRDIAKAKRDLAARYRDNKAAAAGDKDKLAALKAQYDRESDALKDQSDRLADDRDSAADRKGGDKAAYEAAKAELDRKFKDDELARKQAYEKAVQDAKSEKNYPTSISGWAGFLAKNFVGGQVSSALGVLGVPDEPSFLKAFNAAQGQIRVTDKNGKHLWGDYQPSGSAGVGGSPADTTGGNPAAAAGTPAAPGNSDPKDYPLQITKAAKDMGLAMKAAVIGNATALVESGDPMRMFANNAVPESLKLPHDAVGSDHDSVGIFQQRPSWGPVADLMDAYKSAGLFFNALKRLTGWESMDPGAAAQAVQRSAYPDRYATKMTRAEELVKATKLYDRGGWLMPNELATNRTGRPEPILTGSQWDSAQSAIDLVRKQADRGGSAGNGNGPQVVNNWTVNARDAEGAMERVQRIQRERAAAGTGGRW